MRIHPSQALLLPQYGKKENVHITFHQYTSIFSVSNDICPCQPASLGRWAAAKKKLNEIGQVDHVDPPLLLASQLNELHRDELKLPKR